MQLPGRIAAAIEVLTAMEQSHRPVGLALKDWGQSHRFAGSGDRAAIGNLVYDAVRRRLSHAFHMQDETPRALILSVAVRDWHQDPAVLAASFEQDKFAPDAITRSEMQNLTKPDILETAPAHIRADVPEWLAPSLERAFGDEWSAEGHALTQRPSLDMRVNSLKSSSERVLKSLNRFDPKPSPFAPNGIRIAAGTGNSRTPNVQVDEAFQKGWFEIQDEGSQLVAGFAGVKPGMQVLDFCAGAGGKSLALAAMMENKGQIFAHDSDRSRLAPIYDRIKRAGVRNIQTRQPETNELNNLIGKIDAVLVDAPCTGAGTWRRRPDTKWRLTQDQLNQRLNEQAQILDQAMQYLRPGGRLTYITCSILPEENTDQIESFLSRHPNMVIDPSVEQPSSARAFLTSDNTIMLSPMRSDTDGFFSANVLKIS